ncbi:MAG: hypothetical protein JSS61_02820 [Verrucomicrobia bacterium]|nr:hypothetical protein [Verrucomicrobiota bacterium]
MPPEDAQALETALREGLIKEIYLTREMLSNMHQEELSLILHDRGTLHQVLGERAYLIERLSSLRLERERMTAKIHEESLSAEILSLTEQLRALNDRIHRQQTLNQNIAECPERYAQRAVEINRPKRKASVATFQLNCQNKRKLL